MHIACIILSILIVFIVYSFAKFCPEKNYQLENSGCKSWLTCTEIDKIKIVKRIGNGYVKSVYLAKWNNHNVVLLKPRNLEFIEDFRHGLKMLQLLQNSSFIVQLIGFCDDTIVTEYHKNGDARNILYVLSNNRIKSISKRVELCLNYVQILEFLHASPVGTLVSCDTNSLGKLLSQFLITDDFKLILNDLDALPALEDNSNGLILCGNRPITGDFIAPEQRSLNLSALPVGYNEKTDIWKIPSVCTFFLKDHEQKDVVLYELFDIHKKCKKNNPKDRPTASEIIEVYNSVLEDLSNNDEL